MKKIIASLLTFAMLVMIVGPSFAVAETVGTGLTQDTTGGASPIVKAKWEANGANAQGVAYASALDYYMDDGASTGAQFLPSGHKDVNKKIAMCAVVTDPDGLSDVINVYSDVFYP